MTHNIVAQFACSLNEDGTFKEYPVVSGSIFNENYNETLDSATILLSQVSKEDRLSYIEPYQYVRVYDKTTYNYLTDEYTFDKLFLVDNFSEKENNINEHIFSYSISLMSETKWLEKVQCPNLTITHTVNPDGTTSKKTIYQKIKEYMELYIPKVKYCSDGVNWSYQPLIALIGAKHKATSVLSFSASDFTQQGDDYEVSITSAEIDSEIDETQVNVIAYTLSAGNFSNTSLTFDTATRTFTFYGVAQEPVSGTINFGYEYVLLETAEPLYKRFNSSCADMGSGNFTLRQLLTMLMQQVGCIPVVKNRVLTYLDFQLDAQDFAENGDYTLNNTVNYINRSLSSDSYANELINMSNNVLDSENEVISETLGFRDKSSVLIRQTENLHLETKFPIYKVQNFTLFSYVKSNVTVNNIWATTPGVGIPYADSPNDVVLWGINITKPDTNHVRLDLGIGFNLGTSSEGKIRFAGTLVAFKYNFTEVQEIEFDEMFVASTFNAATDDVFTYALNDPEYDYFYFVGNSYIKNALNNQGEGKYNIFVSNYAMTGRNILTLYNLDITPLLVENSIRQNLDNNFSQMQTDTTPSTATIETLAQYIYGTVGYSIGSNVISGFSNTYSVGDPSILGWITKGYTYIENIWNFITTKSEYLTSIQNNVAAKLGDMRVIDDTYWDWEGTEYAGSTKNIVVNSVSGYNPIKEKYQNDSSFDWSDLEKYNIFSNDLNFAYIWFNLTYQPLNSFNLAYVKSKEDVDIPVAQYDSNASGLTDFDRLSINEQEQVDRIGNETLFISQRTADFNDIKTFDNGPLSFKDDTNRSGAIEDTDKNIDYIIFKRTFTINNNCYNANYTGSKDSVLKNYFTSIRTKYRAYQYVDYSSSVLRKERDTIFVRIGEETWYDGDDKVFFGNFTQENQDLQQSLMSIMLYGSVINQVKNCVLASNETQTKNELSVIKNDKFLGFIYEEADNVGSGTYVDANAFAEAAKNIDYLLGGVPQTWQIWEDDYYDSHSVSYCGNFNIENTFNTYVNVDSSSADDILDDFDKVLRLPIINSVFTEDNIVFSIVSDKSMAGTSATAQKRLFYKDVAERINHTTQFIYYSPSKNVIWNEAFFSEFYYIFTLDYIDIADLTGADFVLKNEPYSGTPSGHLLVSNNLIKAYDGSANGSNPYIEINWNLIPNVTQFKVVIPYWRDIVAFKKGENDIQRFYITLNDTKTDYVLGEQNGILYKRYKVATNTSSRTVAKVYEEE